MAGPPHIVVLGAGSVGCFVGGAWAAAGCSVSFVGRQRIADAVQAAGMTLSALDGWKVHLDRERVHFTSKPTELRKADLVLLCVKSGATEEAARDVARHGRKGSTVLSLQNGVSNAERLRALLPGREILHGIVPFNIIARGPAAWHKTVSGEIIAEDAEATRALARQVTSGPAQLTLAADIVPVAWGKLLINLNNAVNALSGKPLLEQLAERDYRRVVAASIIEALEILTAAGIEPAKVGPVPPRLLPHAIAAPDFVFRNLVLRVQRIDPAARSSMLDDLEAGRTTEIDALNGEVVRLARSLGREAPVNEAIVRLVKEREIGVERTWSAADLRRHVLEGYRAAALFGY